MIGQHVAKYQAQKAAAEADVQLAVAEAEAEAVVTAAAAAEADAAPLLPPVPRRVDTAELLAKMVDLLSEIRSSAAPPEQKERLALEAERLLLERERITREMPENKQSPGISVYSRPAGELVDPKPDLKCRIYWIGYEMKTATLTPQEVDLLNKLEPGLFKVTKADGTQIPFKVTVKHDDRFRVEELAVWFPSKDEHRQNHGSMVSYLQQALGELGPLRQAYAQLQEAHAKPRRINRGADGKAAGVAAVSNDGIVTNS